VGRARSEYQLITRVCFGREIDSVVTCVQRPCVPIRMSALKVIKYSKGFNLGHTGNARIESLRGGRVRRHRRDDFGDDVEAAGGHDDVVGFRQSRASCHDQSNVTVDADPNERFAA